MILRNVKIIGNEIPQQIWISGGQIQKITANEPASDVSSDKANLLFDDEALAFPGLINSHDHLDFNLFPQLGNRIYSNYMDWGPDIHRQNSDVIQSILKVPLQLRIKWGIYKNLLNGVTSVAHHGERLTKIEAPINIIQNTYSMHSIGVEKFWKYKLNRPFAGNLPFVIHIGEGTDIAAKTEIDKLIRWNIFNRKVIAVHGIAMGEQQAKSFEALVWCPDSNLFLQGETAAIDRLKSETKVLFGTDSTLSANWNIWEHIRLGRRKALLTDKELFDSLSSTPASIWKLNSGEIAEGKTADIVIAKSKVKDTWKSFFALNPEDLLLIIKNGEIILFDEYLYRQLDSGGNISGTFSKVLMEGKVKHVKGDLPGLIQEINRYNPDISFPIKY